MSYLALLALGGWVVACTPDSRVPGPHLVGAGAPSPCPGGVLHFAVNDDVRTLDPAVGYDEFSLYAEHLIFDTLLAYAPASAVDPLELVPQLAESFTVSPDGLVYSFVIRADATFSDGAPVRAQDFVYALDRLLDPATGSPAQQFFGGIEGAADRLSRKTERTIGLRALDARRLEIRLTRPDPSFPLLLAMKFATPLKRSHVAAAGAEIRGNVLGTGPFVLSEWKEGDALTFARNPSYWDKERPYLDGVVMHVQVPRDVAALKFLRGELDVLDRPSSDDYLRFAQTPEWQPYIERVVGIITFGEILNVRRPPFNDRRVRQAMNYAINKEDTVKLSNQRAVVAHGLLPPAMPGFDPSLEPFPHDPQKARRLLAEAGYPKGFEIRYTTQKDEFAEKVSQSMQADLAEVGIKMRIELVSFPTYLELAGSGKLDFAFAGWLMDFPDPWNFLEVNFHSKMLADKNANNSTGYSNPHFDRLLDQARGELDRAKRVSLYQEAERLLIEDCPWVWHYHPVNVEIRQPYLMNHKLHPVYNRDFRDAWLDEPRRELDLPP